MTAAPRNEREARAELIDTAACSERMKARQRSAMAPRRWVQMPSEREIAMRRGRRQVKYAAIALLIVALGILLAPGWGH